MVRLTLDPMKELLLLHPTRGRRRPASRRHPFSARDPTKTTVGSAIRSALGSDDRRVEAES